MSILYIGLGFWLGWF